MKISYTGFRNPYMRMAYRIAKDLYSINGWNNKAVPVVVIVKDSEILSYGIGGNGMHQMTGICKRVGKKNSPYSDCEWCSSPQHAEIYAIQRLHIDPEGATMYMYGNYRACPDCKALMEVVGIKKLVFLRNANILFNRHKRGTVVGKPEQFGPKRY